MSWIDALDFDLAFRRVLNDISDDPYPSLTHYKEVIRIKDEFIHEIEEKMKSDQYSYGVYRELAIPKKNFTMRPAGAINVSDRVIYQAMIDFLSGGFVPEPCVFSYHVNSPSSDRMFKSGVGQWIKFQSVVEELANEHEYMLETDLAAYFEHIDLHKLKRAVRNTCENCSDDVVNEIVDQLFSLFRSLNGHTRYSGIPQVCDPSSFLGNLFMDEFDKWAQREGFKYIRYVDDMRFFVNQRLRLNKY